MMIMGKVIFFVYLFVKKNYLYSLRMSDFNEVDKDHAQKPSQTKLRVLGQNDLFIQKKNKFNSRLFLKLLFKMNPLCYVKEILRFFLFFKFNLKAIRTTVSFFN